MNYLDIIILVVCVLSFILGFKDGFVRKLIGSVGFFLAIILAIKFSTWLGNIFNVVTGIELYLSEILAGFSIFLLIIVLISIIKRVVHPFDKVNNLINRILGGLVGAIQILIFLSAFFYLTNLFSFPGDVDKEKSFFYKSVAKILPLTISYLQEITPTAKDSLKEYIIEKDSI